MTPSTARAGALLVARPAMGDPNFERSVVYLIDHGESGSLGVILNRPSALTVAEAVPAWAGRVSDPGYIFRGGPVSTGGVVALARAEGRVPEAGWTTLSGAASGSGGPLLGAVDLSLDPAEFGGRLSEVRIFSGYAGWGPGQLAGELAVDAWWVFDAALDDTFTDRPEGLWQDVLLRQGPHYRVYAFAPDDPSVN